MGKRIGRTLLVAGLAAFGIAEAASATLYVSRRYCGGDKFATCAAVQVDVTGNFVTIRLWNLSGNTAGSWGTQTNALTAFNGIGLYNVPPSVDAVTNTLTTTGPAKPGNSAPAPWVLSNNGSVGFLIDFAAIPPTQGTTGFRNTIASGCAPINQLPNDRMFMNPCIDPSAGTQADWMTFPVPGHSDVRRVERRHRVPRERRADRSDHRYWSEHLAHRPGRDLSHGHAGAADHDAARHRAGGDGGVGCIRRRKKRDA
ncbi:MAG: hypothetical protein R2909_08650 [Gemmatimonadales bacterium]